jgi:tetratricopeptide (TPR) repeat protein
MMLADLGERERSLSVINEVIQKQQAGQTGYGRIIPEKLAYLKGNLLFWFDDYPSAVKELEKAVAARADLDLNTALMACLRLGQTRDLLRDRSRAIAAYQKAIELAPQSEIAKECQRYISKAYYRDKIPA